MDFLRVQEKFYLWSKLDSAHVGQLQVNENYFVGYAFVCGRDELFKSHLARGEKFHLLLGIDPSYRKHWSHGSNTVLMLIYHHHAIVFEILVVKYLYPREQIAERRFLQIVNLAQNTDRFSPIFFGLFLSL